MLRLTRPPTTPDMVPHETKMIRIPADQMADLYQRAEGDVATLEDLVLRAVKAEMEAEAEEARLRAPPYGDLRTAIARVWCDIFTLSSNSRPARYVAKVDASDDPTQTNKNSGPTWIVPISCSRRRAA